MKVKSEYPTRHADQHLPDGSDPIPDLLQAPFGTIDAAILATVPGAYYKLNETTGDWADSADSHDATYVTQTGTVRGVASGLDESDGSLCVTVDGPAATTSGPSSNIGEVTDAFFEMAGTQAMSLTVRLRLSELPAPGGGVFSFGVCGTVSMLTGANNYGWSLNILSGFWDPDYPPGDPGKPCFRRRSGGGEQNAIGGTPLVADIWYRLTATYDSTSIKLYVDDTLVDTVASSASLPSGANHQMFRFGDVGNGEAILGHFGPYNGELDSLAVWDRALDESEVGGIADFDTAVGGVAAGSVLTADGAGGVAWALPTFEVDY